MYLLYYLWEDVVEAGAFVSAVCPDWVAMSEFVLWATRQTSLLLCVSSKPLSDSGFSLQTFRKHNNTVIIWLLYITQL